jgi:hypothetical protein
MADGKVTITLKAGRDFDSPWIVVSGDTPAEALANLDQVGMLGGAAAVANAAKSLQATYTVAGATGPVQDVTPPAPTTPTAPPQATAPAAPAAPAPTAPPADAMFCQHGQRTRYEGSKNGRKYVGYFCPLPKGTQGQCEPIWG